jgi:hypothetical protein
VVVAPGGVGTYVRLDAADASRDPYAVVVPLKQRGRTVWAEPRSGHNSFEEPPGSGKERK